MNAAASQKWSLRVPSVAKLRSPVAAARIRAPLGAMQRPVTSQARRAAAWGARRKSGSSRTLAVLLIQQIYLEVLS